MSASAAKDLFIGRPRSGGKIKLVEALRGIAALYVFAHHFAHDYLALEHPRISRLFVFGQVAVLVFFVLSGFVISFSTSARGKTLEFWPYFVRRFRRIYPIFCAALMLGYAMACVEAGAWVPLRGRDLIGNLLMLQDGAKAGTWFSPYWENSPLWSLSYEWFFYMGFFVVSKVLATSEWLQKYAVLAFGLLGALAYRLVPNQFSFFAMYFIIWWSGVEFAREYARTGFITVRKQWVNVALIAVMSVPFALAVLAARRAGSALSLYEHPLIELRHFATALVLLVFGLVWNALGFWGLRRATRFGLWFGQLSYALYVFHRPMLSLLSRYRLTPWLVADLALWLGPLTILLAYTFEVLLQPRINRFFPAVSRAEAVAPHRTLPNDAR